LKAPTEPNMEYIEVTRAVFHALMSLFKADPVNMSDIDTTLAVFQVLTFPLKLEANLNMLFIEMTFAVFHLERSPLKIEAPLNILDKLSVFSKSGESLAVIVARLLHPQKYPLLPSCTFPHCFTSTRFVLLPLFRNANPVRLPVTVTVYVPAVAYV
jgi:hypothetical protein